MLEELSSGQTSRLCGGGREIESGRERESGREKGWREKGWREKGRSLNMSEGKNTLSQFSDLKLCIWSPRTAAIHNRVHSVQVHNFIDIMFGIIYS